MDKTVCLPLSAASYHRISNKFSFNAKAARVAQTASLIQRSVTTAVTVCGASGSRLTHLELDGEVVAVAGGRSGRLAGAGRTAARRNGGGRFGQVSGAPLDEASPHQRLLGLVALFGALLADLHEKTEWRFGCPKWEDHITTVGCLVKIGSTCQNYGIWAKST